MAERLDLEVGDRRTQLAFENALYARVDRQRERLAARRLVDQPLVEAYLARRALDYLVGFTLSPVLWRKLPGSRSAGRVQSVALRLICEREAEIEAFRPQEYWSIGGSSPRRRAPTSKRA